MTCTLDGKQPKERNFLLYPISRLCTTMKLLVLAMHKAVKEIHWDYSIESRHKQFLFTSCNASKKRMSERSKGVRFLLLHRIEWRKIVQAPTMVWCFFFQTCICWVIFYISIERLEVNDGENKSFIQLKVQMKVLHSVNLSMYEINVSTVLKTSTKIWCNRALNGSRI